MSSMSRTLASSDLEDISFCSISFIFFCIMIVFLVIFSPGRDILRNQGIHWRNMTWTWSKGGGSVLVGAWTDSYPFRHLVGVGVSVMVVQHQDGRDDTGRHHEHYCVEICRYNCKSQLLAVKRLKKCKAEWNMAKYCNINITL